MSANDAIKLLRTIRFDASDDAVYETATKVEEWAVSGAFTFASLPPDALVGKTRQAFANGFLGATSFGRSTFAVVASATSHDRDELLYRLARHFVACYGAPDVEAAMPAAEDEVAFAQSLADGQPVNTVLTVRRVLADAGEIKEEFRIIRPPADEPLHARIWSHEDEAP